MKAIYSAMAALALVAVSTGRAQTPAAPAIDAVTVVGKITARACSEHDGTCMHAVAVELWRRYPEQVQQYCIAMRNHKAVQFENYLMLGELAGADSSVVYQDAVQMQNDLPPALDIVCNYKPAPGDHATVVSSWAPWAEAPSAADVAAAYPAAAKGVSGEAMIYCGINAKGRLAACSLSQEFPDGKGFGRAALKLADKFRVRFEPGQTARLGQAHVDIAIRFDRDGGAPAPIDRPDWVALPDPAASAALFPPAAVKAGVASGVGLVDCRIGADGALADCRLVSETPAALGFGEAALSATSALRANLWTRDGRPVAGNHVIVPLRFNAPKPAG